MDEGVARTRREAVGRLVAMHKGLAPIWEEHVSQTRAALAKERWLRPKAQRLPGLGDRPAVPRGMHDLQQVAADELQCKRCGKRTKAKEAAWVWKPCGEGGTWGRVTHEVMGGKTDYVPPLRGLCGPGAGSAI